LGQRYGQHFLSAPTILERIAKAANPDDEPVELIIEIGPGRGALTEYLLQRANRVIAIEIDQVLVHYLNNRFRDQSHKLTVLNQDVLKTDLGSFGPAVIAGNLPYYITSPILERVFAAGDSWQRAVFLVQKEVADRITSNPGSRDFGYLSVQTQLFSTPEILFPVSKGAFRPPPKVESAVFQLTPKTPIVADTRSFLNFASVCFRQKRKTLRNNLLARYDKQAVDALPEAPSRAEQLSLEQLADIWRRLAGSEVAAGHRDEEQT
jgi:16S rRNA (adenine1518-N6/adenine1519-N6)-dimethyltransferase